MSASNSLLVLAWMAGCYGIYRSAFLHDWYSTVGACLLFGSVLAFTASWLHPLSTVKEDETSSVAKLSAELQKLVDAEVKRKLSSMAETPRWLATHVKTESQVLLTISFIRDKPPYFRGRITCVVTTPDGQVFGNQSVESTGMAAGLGVTEEYPQDFRGAPRLIAGKYEVSWQLRLEGDQHVLATDQFEIP
jgi:hypothetical protein